jgi:hypothetical protein
MTTGWSNSTADGIPSTSSALESTTVSNSGGGSTSGGGTSFGSHSSSTTGTGVSKTEGYNQTLTQALSPEAIAALMNTIQQMGNGGTTNQKAEQAYREQTRQAIMKLFDSIGSDNAFSDAEGLMAVQMRIALEKNMPAIAKAVEGAGTSASSMQGLLSNDLVTRSSEASAALGGEQAKAYASERSKLAADLANMANNPNNQVENTLVAALNALKGALTVSNSTSNSTTNSVNNSVTTGTQSSSSTNNSTTNPGSSTSTTTRGGGGGGSIGYSNNGSGYTGNTYDNNGIVVGNVDDTSGGGSDSYYTGDTDGGYIDRSENTDYITLPPEYDPYASADSYYGY